MQLATTHLADAVSVIRTSNPVAAGQATTNTTGVDTKDCDGVLFVTLISTIASTGTVTVTATESDNNSDYTAIAGSPSIAYADDDDNKLAIIDVRNHTKRYVRVNIVTATANGTIDGVVAIKYNLHESPATADETVLEVDKV